MSVPLMLVAIFGLGLVFALRVQMARATRRKQRDWREIVQDLRPLPNKDLHKIAEMYLRPQKNQIEIEPAEIFEMLGGIAGLEIIEHNAKVILELAGYAICWNDVEGAVVTEMIRHDASRLHSAMRSLHWQLHFHQMGMNFRRMGAQVPFQLQEVAAAYHLMTARLLALYETSHMGLQPVLAAAL